jgi:quercetin dioxygenase-like cupin family protein
MPIEIQRFGVGHRRPEGPAGTTGVTGQVIHSDGRGLVAEVAFARGARMEPHASPNTTWMIVIEGGGWVAVRGEKTRIASGEAVLWPADVVHAAWTEHSEMRAIIVEFRGADDHDTMGILEGRFQALLPDEAGKPPVERGEGGLADEPSGRSRPDPDAGEPA